MVTILDILKWAGYSDPVKAYQVLTMDTIPALIHKYYNSIL